MPQHPDGGPHDTTDYSASKAPETKVEAEETGNAPDPRLLPGGKRGAAADVGMSSVEQPIPDPRAVPAETKD